VEGLVREYVGGGNCRFYGAKEGDAYITALTQILALDTRSVHQGRGGQESGHVTRLAASLRAVEGGGIDSNTLDAATAYQVIFDGLCVRFIYEPGKDGGQVLVIGVSAEKS